MHSVNTLAHKLDQMKKSSKLSSVFCLKTHGSILKPDLNNLPNIKLMTTPSIPMPERFYYEQNPQLLSHKLDRINKRNNLLNSQSQAVLLNN